MAMVFSRSRCSTAWSHASKELRTSVAASSAVWAGQVWAPAASGAIERDRANSNGVDFMRNPPVQQARRMILRLVECAEVARTVQVAGVRGFDSHPFGAG